MGVCVCGGGVNISPCFPKASLHHVRAVLWSTQPLVVHFKSDFHIKQTWRNEGFLASTVMYLSKEYPARSSDCRTVLPTATRSPSLHSKRKRASVDLSAAKRCTAVHAAFRYASSMLVFAAPVSDGVGGGRRGGKSLF